MSNEIARSDGARSADGLFAGVHGTVLHIDDSPELLGITEEYITGQLPQYRFITATDASAVADQLAEGVDCVISKYTLPDSNALELLSEVRTHDPDLRLFCIPDKEVKGSQPRHSTRASPDTIRKAVPISSID